MTDTHQQPVGCTTTGRKGKILKRTSLTAITMFAVACAGAAAQEPDSQNDVPSVEDVLIGQRIRFPSVVLNCERTVSVHLPEGYTDNDNPYPVLFVLGGSYFVPFVGVTTYLARDGRIPEAILVAVHSNDWVKDFTYDPVVDSAGVYAGSGGAELFRRFLADELIPYIDANYRSQPFRILVGHSLGGLFAVETMTRHLGLFQVTIAISPSIFYNDGKWVDALPGFLNDHPSITHSLYLALANESLIRPHMEQAVFDLGRFAPIDLLHHFQAFPDETHVSVALPAVRQGLKAVFTGWSFEDVEPWTVGPDGIKAHYDSLSTRFGVHFPIPLDDVVRNGFHALEAHHDLDAAREMFMLALSIDAQSAESHVGLAEIFRQRGLTDLAVERCRRALVIEPTNERARRMLVELGEVPIRPSL